jgi:hypothetical protein
MYSTYPGCRTRRSQSLKWSRLPRPRPPGISPISIPVTKGLLTAMQGHSTNINFSTIPVLMFKFDQTLKCHEASNQVFSKYTQGTQLRPHWPRPIGKEVFANFELLVSWFTKGGSTTKQGSGMRRGVTARSLTGRAEGRKWAQHHPKGCTKRHDAFVEDDQIDARASPRIRIRGAGASDPANPKYFEYFLNPRNHRPRDSAGLTSPIISMQASPGRNARFRQHTSLNHTARWAT